jgi:hypothetical protein
MAQPAELPKAEFVDHLDDLIHPADYLSDPDGRTVRIELRITERGIEILGDAQRAAELERVLGCLRPDVIQQMLCG